MVDLDSWLISLCFRCVFDELQLFSIIFSEFLEDLYLLSYHDQRI